MARAGYCRMCQQNVYLDDAWGCDKGHDWSQISGWYDTDSGERITPPWEQAAATDAQADAAETPEASVEAASTVEPVAPEPAPEPELAPEPEPEPAPEPEPVDPVLAMGVYIRGRLEPLGVSIAETDGTLEVTREDDYSAAIAIDSENATLRFWEQLAGATDPGVRDVLRLLAAEGGWTLQVVLRRAGVEK